MTHEHIEHLNSKHWIMVSASSFFVAIDRFRDRDVAIHLDIPDGQIELPPDTGLALRLAPHEARQIAASLLRKADEAEAGLPRA
jgi:hypothetical protein